jgi:hypothetical protein
LLRHDFARNFRLKGSGDGIGSNNYGSCINGGINIGDYDCDGENNFGTG